MSDSNLTLGFVGLGVMGEPMCRNLARKSGKPVLAFDLRPEPLQRASEDGVEAAASLADLAARADIVFLSLPGEPQVRAVVQGPDGLLSHMRKGQTLVDTSTCPVSLAREIGAECEAKGVDFADAPVARTAQAARDGTLSIMVGGTEPVFKRIEPLLYCMGEAITHCGPVGAGEAVKLMNNMVVVQTVHAIAEALAVARASGAVDGRVLFETLAKSSADSFVLRNHGLNSMLPDTHPRQAFPVDYIIKDLSYAIRLAEESGVKMEAAYATRDVLERAAQQGHGDRYYTIMIKAIEGSPEPA
ncbi:MAG: NAD(P)-dependent oxidoreductase [Alphaproteobacteria bacterium]|nr:NAD(P)-dependent oxidoreductase [Alphaproteobacteria bacterium]MCB9930640.1 NAD(P)-dependent oxidoreductase [Alphaproteobacteria bacterium]